VFTQARGIPRRGDLRGWFTGAVDVPTISAARLDLVSLSPDAVEAFLEGRLGEAATLVGGSVPPGWPDDEDERFLRVRLAQMQEKPETQRWLVRALVLREEAAMAGHAGFHGPPGAHGLASDAVELGYTVFPPYRGRGLATETARALMDWAGAQGVRSFVGSVAPGNDASLAILRKLGFVHTGEQWDEEDGLELVFELEC
jgi:[ribosomal protein S5]-alanine N-acetyltransferase